MAAFSNDKRMSNGRYQNLPGPSNPFPTHQVRPTTYSSDFSMNQPYYSLGHIQPTYYSEPRMCQQPQSPYFFNPGLYQQPQSHFLAQGHFQARGPYQSSFANLRSPSFKGTPPTAPNSRRGQVGGNQGFDDSHESVSAELRPDLFYKKSMVVNPWKNFKPPPVYKKARISEPSSSSQPSLAAYLAAALNETVGDQGIPKLMLQRDDPLPRAKNEL